MATVTVMRGTGSAAAAGHPRQHAPPDTARARARRHCDVTRPSGPRLTARNVS